MSEEPKSELQFDHADFEGAAKASTDCAVCGQTLSSVYYTANGRVLCERCKTDLDLAIHQGSGLGRFLRATLYGIGAGAVGATLWYAVRAAFKVEVGLIAILVGYMVGGAVRKGSKGRGGWRYQALAMFLTYGSIVSTYIPLIVTELKKMGDSKEKAAAVQTASPGKETAPTNGTPPEPMGFGRAVLTLGLAAVFLLALAFAAPFLGGFENIIGLLIIGFGVYEAWKINKRQPLVMTGPHAVGTAEHG